METKCDNDSNSSGSCYNEKLFWKCGPVKFKDITSFDSMMRNKQYELLKCKIKANEYIHYDSFDCLFQDEINDYSGVCKDKETIEKQIQIHRVKSIEILKLLVESLLCKNQDDILCKNDFIKKKSEFLLLFQNLSPQSFDSILTKILTIPQLVKDRSIYFTFFNTWRRVCVCVTATRSGYASLRLCFAIPKITLNYIPYYFYYLYITLYIYSCNINIIFNFLYISRKIEL